MRQVTLFVFAVILAFSGISCGSTSPVGPSPTNPTSPSVPVINVLNSRPETQSRVTLGGSVSVSFRVQTTQYAVATAVAFKREDGHTRLGTCGKGGSNRGMDDYTINLVTYNGFWSPGHTITMYILATNLTQAEYDQTPICIFEGPVGPTGITALFEKATTITEVATWVIGP
jgi:hypothetical protein